MAKSPEQSLREIQELIRKLDPVSTSHKDRIRKLTRFRNYLSSGAPEFYDDDIPLLLLGKESNYSDPSAMVGTTGLLQACGSLSQDPKPGSMLKRSARHVMSLLRYLVCDHYDYLDGQPVIPAKDPDTGELELNLFAQALCCCTPTQLAHMKLQWHLESDGDTSGGKRSGGREDACAVLVMLLTRHMAQDASKPEPLPIQILLPSTKSRKVFDTWLTSRAGPSKDIQKKIKLLQSQCSKQDPSGQVPTIEVGLDGSPKVGTENRDGSGDSSNEFKSRSPSGAPASPGGGSFGGPDGSGSSGIATRWDQSNLSQGKSFKLTKITTAILENEFDDNEPDGGASRAINSEEKRKVLYQDPLGLRGEELDLRQYQYKIETMVKAMRDEFDEITQDGAHGGAPSGDDIFKNKGLNKLLSGKARKDALESAVSGETRKKRESAAKAKGEGIGTESKSLVPSTRSSTLNGCILTTENNFDALLFLTLVHGSSSFDNLLKGLERLDTQTDNQNVRLQSLVRENFGLFLRCTNGVDVFEGGLEDESQIWARLDKMEKLSSNCVYQAKKSFTSLLENTNEVRKTQSALAVLDRMRPILEAPTLMRNHLEAGRFTAAVKAYRRVLVVEENCKVELLRQVKMKATEIARMAQKDLEKAIADPSVNVSTLLDAIRDLQELQSLHVNKAESVNTPIISESIEEDGEKEHPKSWMSKKATEVVKTYPPALACLLLQCKHFLSIVERDVHKVEKTVNEISNKALSDKNNDASSVTLASSNTVNGDKISEDKHRWRYDILEARVVATVQAVSVTRTWLPRLVRIGVSAREAEKRGGGGSGAHGLLTAFDVYVTTVAPAVIRLVEHATFCSLGCSNSGNTNDLDIPMSFGHGADEKVRMLLRAPLPAALSAKCATELAEMVDVVVNFATSAGHFKTSSRTNADAGSTKAKLPDGPLVACVKMAENAVVTAERRRCIYAFDACGRSSAMNASSRGAFDGEVLLQCVQKLSEVLTRPQFCANEIERGCQLVVRRCCEGLASYVRERGTAARLRAVSVCANAISGKMLDVVRDVSYLTGGQSEDVQELLGDDLESLEGVLFEEFLESVTRNVTNCVRMGLSDLSLVGTTVNDTMVFPSYLSSSLLAITRCRAQVEKALGDVIRRSAGKSYHNLAVVSAAESLVFSMCTEINTKLAASASSIRQGSGMTPKQADQLANELQFVLSTLKKHIGHKAIDTGNAVLDALHIKAERSGGTGKGPDGLSIVENLERLGRVYTLCLAEM